MKTTNGIVNGMAAYHKHGEPKEYLKNCESLSDYQNREKKEEETNDINDKMRSAILNL